MKSRTFVLPNVSSNYGARDANSTLIILLIYCSHWKLAGRARMLHIVKNTIRHFTVHKDTDVNVYVLNVSPCRSALSHTVGLDGSIVAFCIYV